MDNPRVNKWLDFLERVIWTALQAAAAATIVVLTSDVDWQEGLAFVGIATLFAVAKVFVGQHVGDETGALLPPGQGTIDPPPVAAQLPAPKSSPPTTVAKRRSK